jgi:hypothetical protein
MKKHSAPKIALFLLFGIIVTWLTGTSENLLKGFYLPFGWRGTCIDWWSTGSDYPIKIGTPFTWKLSHIQFVPTIDFPQVPIGGCFGALNFIAILLNSVFYALILIMVVKLIKLVRQRFSSKH